MSSEYYSRVAFERELFDPQNDGLLLFGGKFDYLDESDTLVSMGFATQPWAMILGTTNAPSGYHFDSIIVGDPVLDYTLDGPVSAGTFDVELPTYPEIDFRDHNKYDFDNKRFDLFLAFADQLNFQRRWSLTPDAYLSVIDHVRKIENNRFRFYLDIATVNSSHVIGFAQTLNETTVRERIDTLGLGLNVIKPLYSNLSSLELDMELEEDTALEPTTARWQAIYDLAKTMGPEIFVKEGNFRQYVIYMPDLTKPDYSFTDGDIDISAGLETVDTEGPYHQIRFVGETTIGNPINDLVNTGLATYGNTTPKTLEVDQVNYADTASENRFRSNWMGHARGCFDTIRVRVFTKLPVLPGEVVSVNSSIGQFTGYCVRCKFRPTKAFSLVDVKVRRDDSYMTTTGQDVFQHSIPTVTPPPASVDSTNFEVQFNDANAPHSRSYYVLVSGHSAHRMEQQGPTSTTETINISGAPSPVDVKYYYNDDNLDIHQVLIETIQVTHS